MISNIKRGFHHKLNQIHDNYRQNPHIQSKHRAIFYAIPIGILLVVATVMSLYMVTYGDKASPATYLAGMDVSGKTRNEIKSLSHDLFNKIKLTIRHGDITIVGNAEDLGLTLRDEDSADAAINEGAERNIFVRFNPFWKKEVSLVADYDVNKFQIFLNNEFADVITPVTEPTLVYDEVTMQFEVAPGVGGRIVNAERLGPTVNRMLASAGAMDITVEITDAEPKLSVAAVNKARDYVNVRIGLRLDLNYGGRLLYFIDPPDIASWAVFEPDTINDELKVIWGRNQIQQFLEQVVIPQLSTSPRNEKILVDKNGKKLMTIQYGRNGLTPADMPDLVTHIIDALEQGANLAENLNLIEKEFSIDTIVTEDNRWIDVNLSTQHITLYDGANALATFIMSSGVAPFVTPVGEFRIVMKVVSQTMRGGGDAAGFPEYNLPNVTWVSYFTYDGHAFHTKYWNNVWGSPSSHGCVGLHEADAKTVYDFAPIGTRVIVHY
jgi:lipoprotein-anchoring transpeptidase ErfK/SrfK